MFARDMTKWLAPYSTLSVHECPVRYHATSENRFCSVDEFCQTALIAADVPIDTMASA